MDILLWYPRAKGVALTGMVAMDLFRRKKWF